jgi:hypothetical protein
MVVCRATAGCGGEAKGSSPRLEITMDKEIEAQQSQKIRKTPGELLKLLHRKGSTPLVAVFFPVSVVSSL